MPATATAVVPYVRAEFAPDDGADEFVDVDLDVGLTPEDEDELLWRRRLSLRRPAPSHSR